MLIPDAVLINYLAFGFMAVIMFIGAAAASRRRTIQISLVERFKARKSGEVYSVKAREEESDLSAKIKRQIAQSGLHVPVSTYYLVAVVASIIIYALVYYLVESVPAAILFAVAGAFVPSAILGALRQRRMDQLGSMFAKALKRMAASLKSNSTLLQAIDDASKSDGVPRMMREELGLVVMEYTFKYDLPTSFQRMYERTGLEDVRAVALATEIAQGQGTNLADVFTSFVKTIQEREEMNADARATLASTRSSVTIMSAMPFLFSAFLKFTQPDYFDAAFAWQGGLGRYFILSLYVIDVVGFLFLRHRCNIRL